MAKYALYVSLKAKSGKEKDVEAFLKQGAEMAKKEAGTVSWFGLKEDEGNYSVFDTFNDEAGRDAHLNGEIAKALMANAALPVSSVAELRVYAAARADALNFGTLGEGSLQELMLAWLNREWKVSIAGIPYKGGGPIAAEGSIAQSGSGEGQAH